MRLWDEQVAEAYRESFAEFSREHPDIEVRVNVVAYSTYFDTLRTDVAGGSADDIFWLSNAYFAGYADNGRLMDIGKTLGRNASRAWEPSVVDQFTRNGVLWGVPQLTDAGIALYYNADLLDAAGVDADDSGRLRWSPGPRRHAAAAAGAAHRRRRRTIRRHTGFRPRRGSGSGATTPPTICRASTSTTSARRAECSPTATGSPSTTRSRPRRSNTWCG